MIRILHSSWMFLCLSQLRIPSPLFENGYLGKLLLLYGCILCSLWHCYPVSVNAMAKCWTWKGENSFQIEKFYLLPSNYSIYNVFPFLPRHTLACNSFFKKHCYSQWGFFCFVFCFLYCRSCLLSTMELRMTWDLSSSYFLLPHVAGITGLSHDCFLQCWVKLRAPCILGKHFINWTTSPGLYLCFF